MKQIDVAYVLHRFPSLTETFVAEEIRNVQNVGARVHLFSLLSPTTEIVHPVSADLGPTQPRRKHKGNSITDP